MISRQVRRSEDEHVYPNFGRIETNGPSDENEFIFRRIRLLLVEGFQLVGNRLIVFGAMISLSLDH